jgi:hypothetical protein
MKAGPVTGSGPVELTFSLSDKKGLPPQVKPQRGLAIIYTNRLAFETTTATDSGGSICTKNQSTERITSKRIPTFLDTRSGKLVSQFQWSKAVSPVKVNLKQNPTALKWPC